MRILGLLVLMAGISGCGGGGNAMQEGGPHGMAMPVSTAQVLEKEISQTVLFTGRIEAVERVDLRARTGGQIQKIHFTEGQKVDVDQVLFELDPTSYLLNVNQKKYAQDGAKAKLDLAKLDLDRSRRLLGSSAVTREDFDRRQAEFLQAEADFERTKAESAQAQLSLTYTKVLSPIRGRIGQALVKTGNVIGGGQGDSTLLAHILSEDPIYVKFPVEERKLHTLRSSGNLYGRKVMVELTPKIRAEAIIDYIDPGVDRMSGCVNVRAALSNSEGQFLPGSFVTISLDSAPRKALLINQKAILTRQDQKYVWAQKGSDDVEYRTLQLGELIGDLRIVLDGLKAGEPIVVNGLQRIRPGAKIQPSLVSMISLEPETGGK